MNGIGIHYAYWGHDWDSDFIPLVGKAKKLGFDILEVNPGTVCSVEQAERDRLKGETIDHEIQLTYCGGLSPQDDISSENQEARNRGIAFIMREVRVLRQMGARSLSGVLYGCWPGTFPPGVADKRPYLERSIHSMREVIKRIEDLDFSLNLEVVNRFEHFLLNTAQEAIAYVDAVGSSRCKILLDTFHMNIEEDSLSAAISAVGRRLGHFHIGETNRRPPGRGRIPWDEVLGSLSHIGYQGPIIMEPFVMPGGEVGRDIRVFRDLRGTTDMDDEAQRACNFIRSKLETIAATPGSLP